MRYIILGGIMAMFGWLGCGAPPSAEGPPASTLRLVPLYLTQQRVFAAAEGMSDTNAIRQLLSDSLYLPYRSMQTGCFGYDSLTYLRGQLDLLRRKQERTQAMAFYDSIGFDTMLANYPERFAAFTGYPVAGTFYFSFFFRPSCYFCGCDMEHMQMDLLQPGNQDADLLRILLPHELSHNTFEETQQDSAAAKTVLYKCIDEGFANYVSEQMAGVSPEEAFGLQPEVFAWYAAHEDEIKERVRPLLFSTREADYDPLGELILDAFMEGSPGNVGYYVGYRIVQEYLKQTGTSDWRRVYTTPVRELYEQSGW